MNQLFFLILLIITGITNAQSIIGEWETFDDKTKEKKSIVEIYREGDTYFGKILETFTGETNEICDQCSGDKYNQPIIGLLIIENLKEDGEEFNSGTILDPENGETYKCYLELETENKLKVRGYIGVSLFGRTQYWIRKH